MAKPKRGSLFAVPEAPEREEAPAVPPAPRAAPARPPSREGKRAVTFYIDPAAAAQLRRLVADEDASVQDLMREALNDLFAKRGQGRIA